MSRLGLTIHIVPRELHFSLIATGGAGLAIWVDVPPEPVCLVALLVAFRVTIRRWKASTY